METTPTYPSSAMPAPPDPQILSALKSASAPTVPPNILYADFATAKLLHTRSARTELAQPRKGTRFLAPSLAFLRRSLQRFWHALLHRARRTRKSLRVAETAALGDRRFVAVVEFERRRFLIGTSPSSVTLLAALPDAGGPDSTGTGMNAPGSTGATNGAGQ